MPSDKLAELISEGIGLLLMIFFIFYSKTNQNLREKKIAGFPLLNVVYFMAFFFTLRILMVLLK